MSLPTYASTVEVAYGASSPIRRVVSHRLQSADIGPSCSARETGRLEPKRRSTASDIAARVRQRCASYGSRHAAYDLKKLRGKRIVCRIGHTDLKASVRCP